MIRGTLLRILYIIILLPILVLIFLEIIEMGENKVVIENYETIIEINGKNMEISEDARDRLLEERHDLNSIKNEILSEYFNSGETTFFDFADLVLGNSEPAGIVIEDYNTHAESDPPAITLAIRGSAKGIVEYLHILENHEKRLPVPRFSISLDTGDRTYKGNLTVNYINMERISKEAGNEN